MKMGNLCLVAARASVHPQDRNRMLNRDNNFRFFRPCRSRRRRRRWRRGLLRRGRILQEVLHHVEAQFFGLAGKHLGELEEAEEEHQLQVLTVELFAFLGGRLAAGGVFAGVGINLAYSA